MSLLSNIQNSKNKLKPAKTVITTVDGRKITDDGCLISTGGHGFVVDTKPDNTPCEIIEGLFLGSQDCVDLEILEKYNINNILSLGIDVELSLPTKINKKFVECLDLPETNLEEILTETCPFIENSLKNGRILVHCNAGVSRSSSVVLGYLIQNKNMTFEEAFSLVKTKRPCIRPNDGFLRQLKMLKNK